MEQWGSWPVRLLSCYVRMKPVGLHFVANHFWTDIMLVSQLIYNSCVSTFTCVLRAWTHDQVWIGIKTRYIKCASGAHQRHVCTVVWTMRLVFSQQCEAHGCAGCSLRRRRHRLTLGSLSNYRTHYSCSFATGLRRKCFATIETNSCSCEAIG